MRVRRAAFAALVSVGTVAGFLAVRMTKSHEGRGIAPPDCAGQVDANYPTMGCQTPLKQAENLMAFFFFVIAACP